MLRPRLAPALALALTTCFAASAAGCGSAEESASLDATIRSDGYALFLVENRRQQKNDVLVRVKAPDPGATYVLLYSDRAPINVGWFLFDPTTTSRCGGDVGAHCEVDGFGYLVDYVTAADDGRELVLRDDRCGCDGDSPKSKWEGYWAVMRVERTDRENQVTFEVRATQIRDYAEEPEIQQLQ